VFKKIKTPQGRVNELAKPKIHIFSTKHMQICEKAFPSCFWKINPRLFRSIIYLLHGCSFISLICRKFSCSFKKLKCQNKLIKLRRRNNCDCDWMNEWMCQYATKRERKHVRIHVLIYLFSSLNEKWSNQILI